MVKWFFVLIALIVGVVVGAVWYATYALRRFDKMRSDFEQRSAELITQMNEAVYAEREKMDLVKLKIKEGALAGGVPEKGRRQLAVLSEILKEGSV